MSLEFGLVYFISMLFLAFALAIGDRRLESVFLAVTILLQGGMIFWFQWQLVDQAPLWQAAIVGSFWFHGLAMLRALISCLRRNDKGSTDELTLLRG